MKEYTDEEFGELVGEAHQQLTMWLAEARDQQLRDFRRNQPIQYASLTKDAAGVMTLTFRIEVSLLAFRMAMLEVVMGATEMSATEAFNARFATGSDQ